MKMRTFMTNLTRRFLVGTFMVLALAGNVSAQNVQRQGDNFVQVSTRSGGGGKETKTKYTYTDSKGTKYPIYLSGSGKAFVKKVSKKTGKEYKQYLPEIGKQINPKAYEK